MTTSIVFPDFQHLEPSYLAERVRSEAEFYKREIDAIRETKESPTFQNTILALERAGQGFSLASSVFFNLLSCNASDELMQFSEELMPLLSDLSNEIALDPILASRVKEVYDYETVKKSLSKIDQRLLWRTYEGYQRGGAFLPESEKKRLKALRKELSLATLQFGQNVLKEQNTYTLQVTDYRDIEQLPSAALHIAKKKAEEVGKDGWLFDFSMPSYSALMKYCSNRGIREQIYRDRGRLAYDREKTTYNGLLTYRIATLRFEIAKILGYPSFAAYRLSTKMAKEPARVMEMLEELREAYMPLAQKEVAEITDGVEAFQPWDWSYLCELYRQKYLQYDEEKTRPYFALENVLAAMLKLACQLYELEIVACEDYPLYHPDARLYKVTSHGSHVGYIMMDFYPRKGKRSGAWMTNYVEAQEDIRPVVSLVMNFTPATEEIPSLLTFDEVVTLFHEFGHGLHGLLTQVPYASLSGTNVVHDFVELPSHFNENWARQPEFIRSFAKHYQTGEAIPDELLDAIQKNTRFLEGYACIRQLGFGYLDMAWHSGNPAQLPQDLEAMEQQARHMVQLFPHIEGMAISTSFTHIFSGGYAAGYYGYKWSEILEADAFEEFLEKGLTDHATAMRFKREILERGDAEDPDVLYRNFKGRAPSIDALKRRSGLIQ